MPAARIAASRSSISVLKGAAKASGRLPMPCTPSARSRFSASGPHLRDRGLRLLEVPGAAARHDIGKGGHRAAVMRGRHRDAGGAVGRRRRRHAGW